MPVVFDSSGPVREMFESFAPQVSTTVLQLTSVIAIAFHEEYQPNYVTDNERQGRKCEMKNVRSPYNYAHLIIIITIRCAYNYM